MNNIIQYVRNRNTGNIEYDDLGNDYKNLEEVSIDTVLQSNSFVDLHAAVESTASGTNEPHSKYF